MNTNKIDLIKAEVKKLHGNPYYMMAVKDALAIIDSLQEEPVSEIDFEQELYKAFGQVKDFTLGMRIAKRFYEMGRNHQEHVSNDFEMALAEMICKAQTSVVEPLVVAAQWKDELIKLAKGEEPVSRTPADIEAAMEHDYAKVNFIKED